MGNIFVMYASESVQKLIHVLLHESSVTLMLSSEMVCLLLIVFSIKF